MADRIYGYTIGGRPVRVEQVSLSADRRTVQVDFVGAAEFDPDNPCSNEYLGAGEIVDGELQVGEQPHPEPIGPGEACALMGHARTVLIELVEPFDGSIVRDVLGGAFLLGPPSTLALFPGLPGGWELRAEGNPFLPGATPQWRRDWSLPGDDESTLSLVQAFGGPISPAPGGERRSVPVNAQEATLFFEEKGGAMVLVWSLGDDELALRGNQADFSVGALVALAESVIPPDPTLP